jgi:hypothetical protein
MFFSSETPAKQEIAGIRNITKISQTGLKLAWYRKVCYNPQWTVSPGAPRDTGDNINPKKPPKTGRITLRICRLGVQISPGAP